MTLPEEVPVCEEEKSTRRVEPEKVTVEFDREEAEEALRGTELESVGLTAPEHTHSKEAFERASKMDPALDPVAHTLLTSTPRGASKSMINHFYGKSPVSTGPPPTREDAEAVLMWQGTEAMGRAEAVRRRREREDRDLPGVDPDMIVCAHCGECEYELDEGTIERDGDWYCSINCLNAEVGP